MHAPYDRSRKSNQHTEPHGAIAVFILPAIAALALLALTIAYPKSSVWIAQAVEAEFGGGSFAEGMPVQTAQPDMAIPMRTVHAN